MMATLLRCRHCGGQIINVSLDDEPDCLQCGRAAQPLPPAVVPVCTRPAEWDDRRDAALLRGPAGPAQRTSGRLAGVA